MPRPKTKRRRNKVAEVQAILRDLNSSPDGRHDFADQVMAHLRSDNLMVIVRVLELLSDYPDVEAKFRQFITARCREWVAEMVQMPPFERRRATRASMRALGVEPSPELLATEARIRFLAARELERRGMGHLIPRVH